MIIALSGPSGIGKGYFKDAIISKHPEVKEIVWYTTRALRPNEKNRQSISEEEFCSMIASGELVLIQEVFDHYYGVKKADLLKEKGIWMTEIHPYIMAEAKRINGKIISIGLVTDDLNLLKDRLVNRRKTEKKAEIRNRLRAAKSEMDVIKNTPYNFDYMLTISRDNEAQVASLAQDIFAKIKKGVV